MRSRAVRTSEQRRISDRCSPPVAGRMGFPVYEEGQGYPCRCHKGRQTLPICVTSRARTPKEPATNRQKGARFIARQCVIRRARCRESGPPCSRGALRSNAPDPPVRNASILPHGSCPGTETGRPGNTFGGLAIRPSRGKMTWFKAGAKRAGACLKSRPWGSDQSPPL